MDADYMSWCVQLNCHPGCSCFGIPYTTTSPFCLSSGQNTINPLFGLLIRNKTFRDNEIKLLPITIAQFDSVFFTVAKCKSQLVYDLIYSTILSAEINNVTEILYSACHINKY